MGREPEALFFYPPSSIWGQFYQKIGSQLNSPIKTPHSWGKLFSCADCSYSVPRIYGLRKWLGENSAGDGGEKLSEMTPVLPDGFTVDEPVAEGGGV